MSRFRLMKMLASASAVNARVAFLASPRLKPHSRLTRPRTCSTRARPLDLLRFLERSASSNSPLTTALCDADACTPRLEQPPCSKPSRSSRSRRCASSYAESSSGGTRRRSLPHPASEFTALPGLDLRIAMRQCARHSSRQGDILRKCRQHCQMVIALGMRWDSPPATPTVTSP